MEQKAIQLLEASIQNYRKHVAEGNDKDKDEVEIEDKEEVVPEAPRLPHHEKSTRFGAEGEEVSYFEPYL